MEKKMYYEGETPGAGKYRCTLCGQIIRLDEDTEALPNCPKCHGMEYEKKEEGKLCYNIVK